MFFMIFSPNCPHILWFLTSFPKKIDNISKSSNETFYLQQGNGDAAQGKYVVGSVSGASGDKALFVANHAY